MKRNLFVLVMMLCIVALSAGCLEQDLYIPESELQELREFTKVEKISGIAYDYHKTHTYVDDDIFDCDNMAQDVWNILKTEGINSEIVLGNTELAGDLTIEDCNHVWILAEVSPNEWLAVETTNGKIIYKEDNERYYQGFLFNNPKSYRNFVKLYENYNYQYADYENEKNYYNYLVETYNDATYFEQIQLKSALDVTRNNLEIKEMRASETWNEIEEILEYG